MLSRTGFYCTAQSLTIDLFPTWHVVAIELRHLLSIDSDLRLGILWLPGLRLLRLRPLGLLLSGDLRLVRVFQDFIQFIGEGLLLLCWPLVHDDRQPRHTQAKVVQRSARVVGRAAFCVEESDISFNQRLQEKTHRQP